MKLKDTLRSIIREEVKRILKENAVPKSGIKITDDDLEKKYFKRGDFSEWLDLFDADKVIDIRTTKGKAAVVNTANEFLSSHGYSWRMKDIFGKNRFMHKIWIVQ